MKQSMRYDGFNVFWSLQNTIIISRERGIHITAVTTSFKDQVQRHCDAVGIEEISYLI